MAESKVLGKGKFLQLVRDRSWEFVERTNARAVVAILAVTAERRIILTDQFRPAVGRRVIDLPAGLAGDEPGHEDESFASSALRELFEETGYHAREVTQVAECPSSPGLTSEVVTLFLASDLRQTSAGGGVAGEQIDIHTPALRGIDRWLAAQVSAGKLIDAKVYAGLYFATRRVRKVTKSRQK
jgi:ADP-ribose pyrophosphatase